MLEVRQYLVVARPDSEHVLEPNAACTRLWTPAGHIRLPRSARELAKHLATMPSLPRTMRRGRHRDAIDILQAHGILDPHDLPQVIVPADPAALDGWRFT